MKRLLCFFGFHDDAHPSWAMEYRPILIVRFICARCGSREIWETGKKLSVLEVVDD